jgi:hypothetical protein
MRKLKGLFLALALSVLGPVLFLVMTGIKGYLAFPLSIGYIFIVFVITSLFLRKMGDTSPKTNALVFTLISSPVLSAVNLWIIFYSGTIHCIDWCGVDAIYLTLPITVAMLVVGLIVLFFQIVTVYKRLKVSTSNSLITRQDFIRASIYSVAVVVVISLITNGLWVAGVRGLVPFFVSSMPMYLPVVKYLPLVVVYLLISRYLNGKQNTNRVPIKSLSLTCLTYTIATLVYGYIWSIVSPMVSPLFISQSNNVWSSYSGYNFYYEIVLIYQYTFILLSVGLIFWAIDCWYEKSSETE